MVLGCTALWAALSGGIAAAEPQPDVEARFRAARAAETERRYADAVAACADVLALAPDGPRGATCARRNAFLDRRRDADGGFDTWQRLEAVRAAWSTGDRAALRAEVQGLADRGGCSDVVRVELAAWLAREALDRGDADAAVAATDGVIALADGLVDDPAVTRFVREVRALALVRLGRDDEAVAVEAPVRVAAPGAPRPTPVEQVVAARRQRIVAWAAAGVIGGFGAASAAAIGIGRAGGRRVRAPWGLAPIAVAFAVAWGLAFAWDPASAVAIPWIAVAAAAVHLVAARALAGAAYAPIAVAVRALAAGATIAAAYLALWWTGTLDWVW